MTQKTAVLDAANRPKDTKTNLVEFGLVLFVFFALLLAIVALSQALNSFHSVHHAAQEGRRSTMSRVATRDIPLATLRSDISFGSEAGAS